MRLRLYPYSQCYGSGSGRIRTFLARSGRLGPDPDPVFRNYPILTFLVCVKAINTVLLESLFNFLDHDFLEHIFIKKIARKKLAKNLCRSGHGSGTRSGRFQKSDLDPVKNCLNLQYCLPVQYYRYMESQFVQKRTVCQI
jgi:hypothetical protein